MRNRYCRPMCNSQRSEESFLSLDDNQTVHMRVRNWWRNLKSWLWLVSSCKVRKCGKQKQQTSQHQICRWNIRHQNFLWKHQMWYRNIRRGNTVHNSQQQLNSLRYRFAPYAYGTFTDFCNSYTNISSALTFYCMLLLMFWEGYCAFYAVLKALQND